MLIFSVKVKIFSLGGIIGASIAMFVTFTLVWYAFQVIAKWKIFQKAGEEGWKSIIPIYSDYTQFKFTWDVSKFWTLLILSVILGLFSGLADSNNEIIEIIGSIGAIATVIPIVIISIKSQIKLAHAFGKSTGFGVGLLFLNPIFMLILGFGKAEYVGVQTE